MPTILVVDDEAAVLDFMRFVLTRNGLNVVTAATAAEAVRTFCAREGEVDLLVTDSVMPVGAGPTLAAHLLALKPGLPVLFVSGYSHELPMNTGSPVRFLQKPFTPKALLEEVNSLLPAGSAASLDWPKLREKSAELARECERLALEWERLEEQVDETMRRSRKLLGED